MAKLTVKDLLEAKGKRRLTHVQVVRIAVVAVARPAWPSVTEARSAPTPDPLNHLDSVRNPVYARPERYRSKASDPPSSQQKR